MTRAPSSRVRSSSAFAGSRFDGHDLAERAIEAGAAALVVERPGRFARAAARGRRHERSDGHGGCRVLRAPDGGARRSRASPGRTGRRRPRSCCTRSSRQAGRKPGPHRHDRVPGRRRAASGSPHDAGGDRPPARVPRDARRGRPELRAGGDLPRIRAPAPRRHPLRVARVHEPDSGSPRPARHDGRLLRGEAPTLPRGRGRRPRSTSAIRGAAAWPRTVRTRSRTASRRTRRFARTRWTEST